MNKENFDMLFALIRRAITGAPLSESVKKQINSEAKKTIYDLSHSHDMAHVVGYALDADGLLSEGEKIDSDFKKQTYLAVYRYKKFEHELSQIGKLFDEEGIDYVVLKGSVLRKYYDTPWMRTSCDIDILCKEDDVLRATTALCERLSYTKDDNNNYHDVSLRSSGGVHLELHFNILENSENIDKVLKDVWSYSVLKTGGEHSYELTH